MKKFLAGFSLTTITILFIYISFSMIGLPSSCDKIANQVLENSISKIGNVNSVTAAAFGFRGYDTFIEAIVLITAVIGTTVIIRNNKKLNGGS